VISFSYWSIKPWFHTEGKLTAVLIKTVFWRRCRGLKKNKLPHELGTVNVFSGAVAEEKEDFCKGSLSLPIFLLCYYFA
jgi:hypothetical protein